ncbi:hypothetical protein GCM10011374_35760 [Kocuria dechangensis]|uniref:Uncharacterized protein n=1 Tax=Kocuria dechangensis TaxID=1176249 RepID=A0A917M0Z2_9MICC|nr:hypothetical protein [Kocuria dechangensis]GGG68258.1 hypothetical protein GCM10011374_35760 [Kocuria dechangensis]
MATDGLLTQRLAGLGENVPEAQLAASGITRTGRGYTIVLQR